MLLHSSNAIFSLMSLSRRVSNMGWGYFMIESNQKCVLGILIQGTSFGIWPVQAPLAPRTPHLLNLKRFLSDKILGRR